MLVCESQEAFTLRPRSVIWCWQMDSHCRILHGRSASHQRRIQSRKELGDRMRMLTGCYWGRWNWIPKNDGREYPTRSKTHTLHFYIFTNIFQGTTTSPPPTIGNWRYRFPSSCLMNDHSSIPTSSRHTPQMTHITLLFRPRSGEAGTVVFSPRLRSVSFIVLA